MNDLNQLILKEIQNQLIASLGHITTHSVTRYYHLGGDVSLRCILDLKTSTIRIYTDIIENQIVITTQISFTDHLTTPPKSRMSSKHQTHTIPLEDPNCIQKIIDYINNQLQNHE